MLDQKKNCLSDQVTVGLNWDYVHAAWLIFVILTNWMKSLEKDLDILQKQSVLIVNIILWLELMLCFAKQYFASLLCVLS